MGKRRFLRKAALAALIVGAVIAPLLVAGATPVFAVTPPPLDPLPLEPHDLERHLAQQLFALSQARQAKLAAQAETIADLAPESLRIQVVAAATRWGLDPRLVASVITVETHWGVRTVGGHGEIGLMQILPETAVFLAKRLNLTSYDLFDVETNLDFGCLYLHMLQEQYGSPLLLLAAYNGGPRAVERAMETGSNGYASKIFAQYKLAS